MIIKMSEHCNAFAENKDNAKVIRDKIIYPAISLKEEKIIIDFKNIESSTQSFIHALLSKMFKDEGEQLLDYIVFRNCNPSIKSIVATVINYSL